MNNSIYTERVKEIMSKLLPKFIERYESQHNFQLPNINILDVMGSVSNIWRVLEDSESPRFNYLGVKVEVDVKDGRIGRVKKLISNTLEKTLDSLGYEYSETYIEFIKTSDLNKEKIEKIENLIFKLIYKVDEHKGWYVLPYSTSDEEGVDWIVKHMVKDVKVEPIKSKPKNMEEYCVYEAEVTLVVKKILIGSESEDEWEKMYRIHDLPEHSWDKISEEIESLITKMLPEVCEVGVKYEFDVKY
jgi:hypothetical protein